MKLNNSTNFFFLRIYVEKQELSRKEETVETHGEKKKKTTNKVQGNTWVHPNMLSLKKSASNPHGGITAGMTPPHDLDFKEAKEANPRW